ncbi:hypothetical protein [Billgrantia endophytica]|uniref:Glycosyl transferase family 2 n=1 Tax=Billgrantia endophytica TaxID=2033802 RepID=A0A2N7U9I3_9GAMM|nr:hypothetical protein [Halomonas endophytica]PMR77111.1 hypothetical protein C1H69_03635 [Halomonas endophytica]
MLISVLLDARSSGAQLPRQLSSLHKASQSWKGYELLIVDDTLDGRLPALASRYGVRLLPCAPAPLGNRMNTAVGASQGDLLLFPGLVARRSYHWLDDMISDVKHGAWDVAILPARRQSVLFRLWGLLLRVSPTDTFCVTRDWFERIGGFDPGLEAEAVPELLERLHACQARVLVGSA